MFPDSSDLQALSGHERKRLLKALTSVCRYPTWPKTNIPASINRERYFTALNLQFDLVIMSARDRIDERQKSGKAARPPKKQKNPDSIHGQVDAYKERVQVVWGGCILWVTDPGRDDKFHVSSCN